MRGCHTCHLDGGIGCDWPCALRYKVYPISLPTYPDDSAQRELVALRHRVAVLEGMNLVRKPPRLREPKRPAPQANDRGRMLHL